MLSDHVAEINSSTSGLFLLRLNRSSPLSISPQRITISPCDYRILHFGEDPIKVRLLLAVQAIESFCHPVIPAARQELHNSTRK